MHVAHPPDCSSGCIHVSTADSAVRSADDGGQGPRIRSLSPPSGSPPAYEHLTSPSTALLKPAFAGSCEV